MAMCSGAFDVPTEPSPLDVDYGLQGLTSVGLAATPLPEEVATLPMDDDAAADEAPVDPRNFVSSTTKLRDVAAEKRQKAFLHDEAEVRWFGVFCCCFSPTHTRIR